MSLEDFINEAAPPVPPDEKAARHTPQVIRNRVIQRTNPDPKTGNALTRKRADNKAVRSYAAKQFTTFVKRLRRGDLHGDAMKAANLSWPKLKSMIEKYPKYQQYYDEALVENAAIRQRMREDEADRRAMEGTVTKTINARGKVTKRVVAPSDILLKMQLEANDPEKYGKKNQNGVTINNVSVDAETVNTLRAVLARNQQRDSLLPEKEVEPLSVSPSPITEDEGDDEVEEFYEEADGDEN